MELKSHKCSSIAHKEEVDAFKYCQECKIYLCRNCDKFHSNLLQSHHTYPIDKDLKEIFTGFCKIANHQSELNYFCKDHNELVCAKCITKMKGQGNGQHTDCNIHHLEDICEEKKKNLADNIKKLDNLSKLFQASIDDLKKIFDAIEKNKEEVKKEIQTVFTNIRTELNKREDELLKETDIIYEKKIFNQNIDVIKDKNFPEKIKLYIENGKLVEQEWNKNKNKNSLINDCINIEKTINKISKLNENLEGYKVKNKKLKFYSEPDYLLSLIKKQGSFNNNNNINQQEININIDDFNPQNLSFIKQISSNYGNADNSAHDNVCFFISRNDEYVLGFANSGNTSIIFYDINNDKELKTFNNAHSSSIYAIKHYNYSKYDMILSSAYNSDNIKIWNFNESKNILTISNIFYYSGYYYPSYSSCIILEKNTFNIFCVTVSFNDYIKEYNSEGNLVNNIGNNSFSHYYIDSCEVDEKKYLIAGGNKGIEVYNYPDLTQYYCFIEGNDSNYHTYAKIVETIKGYNLIEVGNFNTINIWDFVNKKLISKINSDNNNYLRGFVIINNEYLFIGSRDKNIKEFDIGNKAFIKNFNKHTSTVVGLKTAKDKNGNNFIISYGQDNNIFLWGFK